MAEEVKAEVCVVHIRKSKIMFGRVDIVNTALQILCLGS